jgi:ankyrin repeat protein
VFSLSGNNVLHACCYNSAHLFDSEQHMWAQDTKRDVNSIGVVRSVLLSLHLVLTELAKESAFTSLVSMRNHLGLLPVHLACASLECEAQNVDMLSLPNGMFEPPPCNRGNTPLHEAVIRGNFEAVKKLLSFPDARSGYVVNAFGETPLVCGLKLLALNRRSDCVVHLHFMQTRVRFDAKDPSIVYPHWVEESMATRQVQRDTAVPHHAIVSCVNELLNCSADAVLEQRDCFGYYAATVFMEGVRDPAIEAPWRLLNVNVCQTRFAGDNTALHLFASQDGALLEHAQFFIARFVECASNLEALNARQCTPLLEAAQRGTRGLIVALIMAGCNINVVDKMGDSVLHCCVRRVVGSALVLQLLQRGANANTRNVEGQSVIECAASSGQALVVRLLLQYGAVVDASVLDVAERFTASFGGHSRVELEMLRSVVVASSSTDPIAVVASFPRLSLKQKASLKTFLSTDNSVASVADGELVEFECVFARIMSDGATYNVLGGGVGGVVGAPMVDMFEDFKFPEGILLSKSSSPLTLSFTPPMPITEAACRNVSLLTNWIKSVTRVYDVPFQEIHQRAAERFGTSLDDIPFKFI